LESEASRAKSLHVLIACHNRRDLTVRAITTFSTAATAAGVDTDFTVFDDGSTDGTAEALAALELPIHRISGDGSAFWSRSMAEAEDHVLHTCYDDGYIVWLNDDVDLDSDFLEVVLEQAKRVPSAVLVGAMRDPETGNVVYSGYRLEGFHPLSSAIVEPNGTLQTIDIFDGNFVCVPVEMARALGGIDGKLSHFGADTDYGMRVREGGFELLLLPRTIGFCTPNPVRPLGPAKEDWRIFLSVKGGGNYNTLKRILRKRHPHTWLIYIAMTYSRWWSRRSAHILSRKLTLPVGTPGDECN